MNLKSYASYFVSYLLHNFKKIGVIENVILFGSVAKDQATKESDIDIFIEVKKKTKSIEKEIRVIEQQFYKSREATLFKAEGIENPLSIKVGQLKDWPDLSQSIASTGIMLFGRYEAKKPSKRKTHQIIIYWDNIGKNRGSFLNKVYGFSIKGKHYQGVLEKYGGRKIGKSSIMLPIQFNKEIFKLLDQHQVKAKIIEVFV